MKNYKQMEEKLQKNYQKVIEARLSTEKALTAKQLLFQKNTNTIDQSLHFTDEKHDQDISDLNSNHDKGLAHLSKENDTTQSEFKKTKKNLYQTYQKDIKEAEDYLDKKRSLNDLKEEKIKSDYLVAIRETEKTYKDIRNKYDKIIEEATQSFYEHTIQLEKETEIKTAKVENQFKQKELAFSNDIDRISEDTTAKLDDNKEKLKHDQINFHKTIKSALDAYKTELKPINDAIKTLKSKQKKELTVLNKEYEDLIGKKTKFKNEKEKIEDKAAVSRYQKEIKQAKKEQNQAISAKKLEHVADLSPLENQKTSVIKKHENNLIKIKTDTVNTLKDDITLKQTIKANDLIDTNTTNIDSLIEQARYESEKESIKSDYDIQLINFNQTLEESRLLYQKNTNLIKPEEGIKTEESKRVYNLEKNALQTKRNAVKAEHNQTLKLREIKYNMSDENLEFKNKKYKHNYQHQMELQYINHQRDMINKDFEQENYLINHYYHYSKNYTALKNEAIYTYNPSVQETIETHKKHQIAMYKDILKNAEVDHDIMIDKINDTYSKEVRIYQTALDNIEQNHKNVIKDLTNHQALERNKDLEVIESLDIKKDKLRIKKLKQNLVTKQAHHDEALAIKKRDLEQKRSLYETMIEQIKTLKMQSIEEADTLLIHIKDQIQHTVENIEKTANQDTETYNTLYYEIKHSAELFNTFQLQRKEETTSKTTHYMNTRLNRQQDLEDTITKKRDEKLQALKHAYDSTIENYQKNKKIAEEKYQIALETFQKTKVDEDNAINEKARSETKHLNQQIHKIKRDYDQKLKTLTQDIVKQKDVCFENKEASEKALQEKIETRQKEAQAYKEERLKILNEDKEHVHSNATKLIAKLKKEPLASLTEKAIIKITDELEGIDSSSE